MIHGGDFSENLGPLLDRNIPFHTLRTEKNIIEDPEEKKLRIISVRESQHDLFSF